MGWSYWSLSLRRWDSARWEASSEGEVVVRRKACDAGLWCAFSSAEEINILHIQSALTQAKLRAQEEHKPWGVNLDHWCGTGTPRFIVHPRHDIFLQFEGCFFFWLFFFFLTNFRCVTTLPRTSLSPPSFQQHGLLWCSGSHFGNFQSFHCYNVCYGNLSSVVFATTTVHWRLWRWVAFFSKKSFN